jgi:hypothetical protein
MIEKRAREVRLFAAEGQFLSRFGRRGEGPGEFQALQPTRIIGNLVEIWDPVLRRVSKFSLGGELMEADALNTLGARGTFLVHGFFPAGELLVSTATTTPAQNGKVVETSETLYRWAYEEGTAPESIETFQVGDVFVDDAGVSRPIPLMPNPSPGRVVGQKGVYVASGRSLQYQRYGLDGVREQVVKVLEPRVAIGREFVEEFKKSRVRAAPEGVRSRLQAAYEQMPLPTEFPMLDRVFVDAEENVWIRRFRIRSSDSQVWHVFDFGGTLTGTIHVPPGLDVRTVHRDRLLGRWTDDMGVQSIRAYRLDRGDG